MLRRSKRQGRKSTHSLDILSTNAHLILVCKFLVRNDILACVYVNQRWNRLMKSSFMEPLLKKVDLVQPRWLAELAVGKNITSRRARCEILTTSTHLLVVETETVHVYRISSVWEEESSWKLPRYDDAIYASGNKVLLNRLSYRTVPLFGTMRCYSGEFRTLQGQLLKEILWTEIKGDSHSFKFQLTERYIGCMSQTFIQAFIPTQDKYWFTLIDHSGKRVRMWPIFENEYQYLRLVDFVCCDEWIITATERFVTLYSTEGSCLQRVQNSVFTLGGISALPKDSEGRILCCVREENQIRVIRIGLLNARETSFLSPSTTLLQTRLPEYRHMQDLAVGSEHLFILCKVRGRTRVRVWKWR